jgi:DNA-binding CsgD family transcriptional regulator
MSTSKTAIISANKLIAWGIAHYIRLVDTDPEIEIFDRLHSFDLNVKNDFTVIFLDPALLAEPVNYSVEKLYNSIPGVKLLALAEKEPEKNIQSYFEAFIHFQLSEDQILDRLRSVYQINEHPANTNKKNSILSEREEEILRYVALGNTNKEISEQLSISMHTVITHRKNITAKLGIKTIAGLTIYAVLNGIISADEMISG